MSQTFILALAHFYDRIIILKMSNICRDENTWPILKAVRVTEMVILFKYIRFYWHLLLQRMWVFSRGLSRSPLLNILKSLWYINIDPGGTWEVRSWCSEKHYVYFIPVILPSRSEVIGAWTKKRNLKNTVVNVFVAAQRFFLLISLWWPLGNLNRDIILFRPLLSFCYRFRLEL